MSNKLTIEQLKEQYRLADKQGREWLSKVQNEDEHTLNAIATIHMNACTQVKSRVLYKIGEAVIENRAGLDSNITTKEVL